MTRRLARLTAIVFLLGGSRAAAQQEFVSYAPWASYTTRGKVTVLVYSYSGAALAIGSSDGTVTVYAVATRQATATWSVNRAVLALAFSRDDRYVVVGTDGGGAMVRDQHSGLARALGGDRGVVRAVAVNPTNDLIATTTERNDIVFWGVETAQEAGRITRAHEKNIRFLMFQGRGDLIVSIGEDRQIVQWDVKSKQRRRQTVEADPYIFGTAGSPGGEWVITGTEQTQLPGYRGGRGVVRQGLAYIDQVKIYNLETGIAEKIIDGLVVEPRKISLSADYKVIAVGERDTKRSTVGLWDVDRGVRIGEIASPAPITDVAFSPDGRWLAFGDEAGQVNVQSVKGVQPRLAYSGNLTGRKYVLTSPPAPLVKPSRRMRIAILDLDDNGVGRSVANAIADQLANRLAANPGVRLVERRRMNLLLAEQNLQASGRTDAATAVQMAKILNVQKVVLGAVAKLGTTMTITAQLVDVETAAIDGVREMQCNNCALEDLSQAVAELTSSLVAPADHLQNLPDPPEIELEYPREGDKVSTNEIIVRGHIKYSKPLEGIELIVNGQPFAAGRALNPLAGTKTTKLSGNRMEYSFVQQVPLQMAGNVIAVRAIGGDGNDDQRYVAVQRFTAPLLGAGRAVAVARSPALSLVEVLDGLANGVAQTRLATLSADVGVGFAMSPENVAQIRALGANAQLIQALTRTTRR